MQIIDYEKNQTLGQNDTGFSCDGTASTFRVMFKEPIEILPTVCYTACATLKVRMLNSIEEKAIFIQGFVFCLISDGKVYK